MRKNVEQSLGICVGASTVTLVEVERRRGAPPVIVRHAAMPHQGGVRQCVHDLLQETADLGEKLLCATGRKFRHSLNLSTISEPEATELAVRHILPAGHPYRLVISAGGENFLVYRLDDHGSIGDIATGNKCAAGTGDFFLQQLRRMDIPLAEAMAMELPDTPFRISGRCSVFCKSDCTHALNKGVAKNAVVAGLARMMADKLLELVQDREIDHVLLVGDCAGNSGMVHYLRQRIPDLAVPAEASCFEALGAALWALDHARRPYPGQNRLFCDNSSHLSFHQPLASFRHLVRTVTRPHGQAKAGDRTILGLDVGSTTTKGVLLRRSDKKVLASAYLRTVGDPVGAARRVYSSLKEQLQVPVVIEALGATGSGRQLAGLHAMTPGVVNEIIAHATAAAFYDPQVDTILELGGQDAKYTFLANGVPNDYAMNEACSAGTGSFLEESARESLGLAVGEIGDLAFLGEKPPNFSDQCAAFIGSDIKNAVQQHLSTENIVAGLVYSVALNFINRVKGNRPIGRKIFIQGGVCYNLAVPVAMAALTGKEVIVPPDPGLIGAFGVALEVEKRLDQGLIPAGDFDLEALAAREVGYERPFICSGGREQCDRKCEIARIRLAGRTYPFGGICNRYDNILGNSDIDSRGCNLVAVRQHLIFAGEEAGHHQAGPTVRMNRSFLLNTYYPFYRRFLAELGMNLVLPQSASHAGIARRGAQFCYPAELAHGYLAEMLELPADFTLLPHLAGLPSGHGKASCTCVFVQSEPFYLRSAFRQLEQPATLTPTLDFSAPLPNQQRVFEKLAVQLGETAGRGRHALARAREEQTGCQQRLQEIGRTFLTELERQPERFAVILFGRPYNSFTDIANKGVPLKFASRGVPIVPFDLLPFEESSLDEGINMYWAMGDALLRCAKLVAGHPQLFAVYITNFSCGPDSFIITYFRDIMGDKPSLTLELDSHTADAGLETRIEAFLDIISACRRSDRSRASRIKARGAAAMEYNASGAAIRTAEGKRVELTDRRVKLLVPAMGRFGTPLLAKAFAGCGIRTEQLPAADVESLKLGRGHSSCKECLPLQTTIGTVLRYLQQDRPEGQITAYLMPSADGPCRFGQYSVLTRRLIARQNFADCAVFSPASDNCYGGLGRSFQIAAWRAIVTGDLFDEMWSTLLTAAADKEAAMALLAERHRAIGRVIAGGWRPLARELKKTATKLAAIDLTRDYRIIPKISLIGEIYVRHDPLSLQLLVERLAARGFAVRTAPNSEWFKYVDWLIEIGLHGRNSLNFRVVHWLKERIDRQIRHLLAPAGLFHHGDTRVRPVVGLGARYLAPAVQGEAILTIGSAFHDILNPACGIIAIGPFGCMPSRVAEAILHTRFTAGEKKRLNGQAASPLLNNTERRFPFLAIETDGAPFPQIIEARLEAFCLQAERLHREMLAEKPDCC